MEGALPNDCESFGGLGKGPNGGKSRVESGVFRGGGGEIQSLGVTRWRRKGGGGGVDFRDGTKSWHRFI